MRLSQHVNQALQHSNLKVYILHILPVQFEWAGTNLVVTSNTHKKNTSVQLLLYYHKIICTSYYGYLNTSMHS